MPWATGSSHPHHLLGLVERCATLRQTHQLQAQLLLNGLVPDQQSPWNAPIRARAELGPLPEALRLYQRLLHPAGPRPDPRTFPSLLKACARAQAPLPGAQLLAHAARLGALHDLFVANAALHLLCRCGLPAAARRLFDQMPRRDAVSWNSLLSGLARAGLPRQGLTLFRATPRPPDPVALLAAVRCCAQLADLRLARRLHRLTLAPHPPPRLSNALLDMYVKCGSLPDAERVFATSPRTVVTWTSLIGGHLRLGSPARAVGLFWEMPARDSVAWNVMIGGWAQMGRPRNALTFFREMQRSKVDPDEVTMVNVFSACAQLGALEAGLWAERFALRRGFRLSAPLGTALVDMHAKCGSIDRARSVFHRMPERNVLTWTAMVNGLAAHGLGCEAVDLFDEMVKSGPPPDEVTFLGLLSACAHTGLVDHGRRFFDLMRRRYRLGPGLKHYSCMVDLLGRAGRLEEAELLIQTMPMAADAVIWAALFFACRVHGDEEIGRRAAAEMLALDDQDCATYVSMAGMHMEANRWAESGEVRRLMGQRRLEKTPGCSSIEVNGEVNEFKARDPEHPQSAAIYACAGLLSEQIKLGN
ncbi:pentatricopeptide repeat-containing protein At2g22410, mitochondrial-like [Wolffia australiana]